MLKKLFKVLRKVVIAILLLYSFNVLIASTNVFVPINYVTISVVSFLGIPGVVSLFMVQLLGF